MKNLFSYLRTEACPELIITKGRLNLASAPMRAFSSWAETYYFEFHQGHMPA